jgi:hypothetical protein
LLLPDDFARVDLATAAVGAGDTGNTCRPLCTGGVVGGEGCFRQKRPTSSGLATVTEPSSVREQPAGAASARPIRTVSAFPCTFVLHPFDHGASRLGISHSGGKSTQKPQSTFLHDAKPFRLGLVDR